jgi:mannosyltransferase
MALVRRFADVAMFDGESLIAQHVGSTGLSIPTRVYYPPVATSEFVPSPERRAALRASLGIPSNAYVIGTVANLNPQKGIEYFVHAARLIADQIDNAWFVIVGAEYRTHKRYADELRQMVPNLGLRPERVIFAGDRPDVENWYAAMDIKLITSVPNSEGTTTTAMEAMSCGLPVVASDVGSVRDVVQQGVTGLLVPPKNAAAIAGATLSILRQPDLRARMSVAAREAAVRRFDVEVCADSHAEAFAAAIHRRQVTSDRQRIQDEGTLVAAGDEVS